MSILRRWTGTVWEDVGVSSTFVTTDTAQTISGVKTFSSAPVFPNSSIPIISIAATGTRDSTTYLRGDGTWAVAGAGGAPSNMVTTDTVQTINASKTIRSAAIPALALEGAPAATQTIAMSISRASGTIDGWMGIVGTTRFLADDAPGDYAIRINNTGNAVRIGAGATAGTTYSSILISSTGFQSNVPITTTISSGVIAANFSGVGGATGTIAATWARAQGVTDAWMGAVGLTKFFSNDTAGDFAIRANSTSGSINLGFGTSNTGVAALRINSTGVTTGTGIPLFENGVRVYSATNPPPYPVTSVATRTGAVALTASDIDTGTFSGTYNFLAAAGTSTTAFVFQANAAQTTAYSRLISFKDQSGTTKSFIDPYGNFFMVELNVGATGGSNMPVTGIVNGNAFGDDIDGVVMRAYSPTYFSYLFEGQNSTGAMTFGVTGTGDITGRTLQVSGLTGATSGLRLAGATASGAPVSGTWAVGDVVGARDGHLWMYKTGNTWVDIGAYGSGGGGAVSSVAGRTGAVTLAAADITPGTSPAGHQYFQGWVYSINTNPAHKLDDGTNNGTLGLSTGSAIFYSADTPGDVVLTTGNAANDVIIAAGPTATGYGRFTSAGGTFHGAYNHLGTTNAVTLTVTARPSGSGGQSANLMEFRDAAGTAWTNIDSGGNITSLISITGNSIVAGAGLGGGSLTINKPTAATSGAPLQNSNPVRWRTSYYSSPSSFDEDITVTGVRRSTTSGDAALVISHPLALMDATFAPTTTVANQVQIYSSGGRGKVRDSVGNVWNLDSSAYIRLTSAYTNTTTSMSTTGLGFTAVAPGTYAFEINGFYTTSVTTTGLRLQMQLNGGTQTSTTYGVMIGTGTTASANGAAVLISTPLGSVNVSSGATALPFQVTGSIVITVAGTFALYAASGASGTINILTGSYMRLSRIA